MFAATDTEFAPWYIVPADDQRRARLNCIKHLLILIPYEDPPYKKRKLGKRQAKPDGVTETPLHRVIVPREY